MKGIYFITDDPLILEEVIDSDLGAVQYRNKRAIQFKNAEKMQLICKQRGIPFIVNDRVDLALLLNADGVHLGQKDFPLMQAKELLGPSKIIGATASNKMEALRAMEEGADYIGLGHIYPTTTKEKIGAPIGIELLRETCQFSSIPIFAIGGIGLEHVPAIKKAGACGIAICSSISQSKSPQQTAKQLVEAWNDT